MDNEQKKKIWLGIGIAGVLSLVAYRLLASKPNSQYGTGLFADQTKPETLDNSDLKTPPYLENAPSIEDYAPSPSELKSENVYSFKQMADDLQSAFNGYGTAWDNGAGGGVLGIISQLKSDADFDELEAAFGKRKIGSGFLNIFSKDYIGDMNGAFNSELNKSEIEEINLMLENQGLTRRINPTTVGFANY